MGYQFLRLAVTNPYVWGLIIFMFKGYKTLRLGVRFLNFGGYKLLHLGVRFLTPGGYKFVRLGVTNPYF